MPRVAPSASRRHTQEQSAEALIGQPVGQQFDAELHVRWIDPTPLSLRAKHDVGALRRGFQKKLQIFVQAVGDFQHRAERG